VILHIYYDMNRRGKHSMALDMLLLREALRTGEAHARIYSWTPSAVSIGRRQEPTSRLLERASRLGLDVVRRPTGGTALLHAENFEVTYSIAVPPGSVVARYGVWDSSYLIASRIAEALQDRLGLPVEARGPEGATRSRLRPELCLSAPGPGDLVVGGLKAGGAAQYRAGGGLLQHGQVLLYVDHTLWSYLFNVDTSRIAVGILQDSGPSSARSLLRVAEAVASGLSRLPDIMGVSVDPIPLKLQVEAGREADSYEYSRAGV